MFSEDDLIPVSALQHALFCERQFALIHIEQLWEENLFTAEGRFLHERVDVEHHESRKLFRQEYGMAIRSLKYGLIGKCDLVELYLDKNGNVQDAIPVEFKRGTDKEEDVDRVQLCAQALCLEEMFGITITNGQFYYLKNNRRTTTEIDSALRKKTIDLCEHVRYLFNKAITPPALYEKHKCDRCSLVENCMPKKVGSGIKRVDRYIQTQLQLSRMECEQ